MKQVDLSLLMVKPSASLLEALRVIDAGAVKIALVSEDGRRLLGVATDGDVRRGLIRETDPHASLEPYYTRNFRSVEPEAGRAEVLELMTALHIEHLPIVDAAGELKGMHLLSDLTGAEVKNNWALIMAGGRGTRLGAITAQTPKPMVKVAGRPILERIILHLIGSGIRRIYISVNYLGHLIEEHFGDGGSLGCEISYLREREPLGTGGALSLLPEIPDDPVLVMNGDLVTEFSVDGLLETHRSRRAAATVGVRKYTHTVPYGCIDLRDGLVTGLREKPEISETINAGIYAIGPELIRKVPAEYFPITDLIEQAIKDSRHVAAYHIDEWIDVGEPRQLAMARGEMQ